VFLSLHTGHVDVAVVGLTAALHYLRSGRRAGRDDLRIVSDGGGVNAQGNRDAEDGAGTEGGGRPVAGTQPRRRSYLALYRKNFGIDPPHEESCNVTCSSPRHRLRRLNLIDGC